VNHINMAEILGFGCMRKGCTKISGDRILHISMVTDKVMKGKKVSPGIVLKIGDHEVRCLEGYIPESTLLRDMNNLDYTDFNIENIIDTLRRVKYYRVSDGDYLLDAIVFKLYRRFRELISILDHRPDLIYVSGRFSDINPFLRKLADYTGYYIASSERDKFIDGVYSLLRIYGGRGKFDDILEAEEGLRLIKPSINEEKRLEIISKILKGINGD